MRYQRKRMSLGRCNGAAYSDQTTNPTPIFPAVRHFDDHREICLNNLSGRTEYDRRKQLLWEQQDGRCEHCGGRMRLTDCRLTHGSWTEQERDGYLVLRDDRLQDRQGRQVNWLVHKGCLRDWHKLQAMGSTGQGQQQK